MIPAVPHFKYVSLTWLHVYNVWGKYSAGVEQAVDYHLPIRLLLKNKRSLEALSELEVKSRRKISTISYIRED